MIYPVYNVLNLLASSWQMRLQLGLWVEFVENANGWRLFVPEMGTPCQHGAAVDLWEGRQERERREGVGAVRNGGGVADGCTTGACTPDMPLVASVGGPHVMSEFDA